jgi:branched-chain amino acid aminotransferase
MREAFACGTAAVVAGIGKVKYRGGEFAIGNSGDGEVTTRLRASLTGIQRGKAADPHGWTRKVTA